MMYKLGLNNQMELQDELENRRNNCEYQKEIIMFQYDKKLKEYKEFFKANPHLYQDELLIKRNHKNKL